MLNPSKRNGMLAEAENDILKHPLLAHIDVQKLVKKELLDALAAVSTAID